MKKNFKQVLIVFTTLSVLSCSKEDNDITTDEFNEEPITITYHGANLSTTNEDHLKIIAELSEKEELNVVHDLLKDGDIHFFDDDEDYYGFIANLNPSLEKEVWQSFKNDQNENIANSTSEKSLNPCGQGLQSSFSPYCNYSFRVALYQHTNLGGDRVYMGVGNLSYVGSSWNDRISSLQIEKGNSLDPLAIGSQRARLTIYEHSNYNGKRQRFHVDSGAPYTNGYINDTTYKVFNLTNYTMIWRLFRSNTSWNDQVSSMKLKHCGHSQLGTCL